jgi:hypothetical protein
MLGPVFQREATRADRRLWLHLCRWAFAGCVCLLLVPLADWLRSVPDPRAALALVVNWAERSPKFIVVGQCLLLVLLAPALTAGAVTEEKTAGTLQLLLAAGLTSWDVLAGKLLGRLLPLLFLLLAGWPLLSLCAGLVGQTAALPVLLVMPLSLLAAAGAAGLLASVWSRTTTQALLGVYTLGVALALAVWWLGAPLAYLNPFFLLEAADSSAEEQLGGLLCFVTGWGVVAVVCLGLAAWRLRPVYLAQLEARGRTRDGRAPARPPLADNPLCWKERYLDGVAPVLAVRWVPRWLGVGLVLTLSAVFAGSVCWSVLLGPPGRGVDAVQVPLFLHGLVVTVLTVWLVGVRAAGSITGEERRQTWDLLLLTDLDAGEIVRGKQRGIVLAFCPYLLAAMLPALLVPLIAGPEALLWPLCWSVVLVPVTYFMAAVGVNYSTSLGAPWGSLCATLGAGSAMVWGLASLATLPVCCCLALLTACGVVSTSDHGAYLVTGLSLEVGFVAVCFLVAGWFFLWEAERWVRVLMARRERGPRSRRGPGTAGELDPGKPHV